MEPRLTLLVIWLLFTSRALLVESQNHPNVASPRPSPSPPPQPPSLATSPHPPMSSPSRRVSPHPPPRRVPPHPPPPPPPAKKMNSGKKIGLLFVGIAGVLQIGVVAFLVLQRRRLLSMRDRYENCSS